ncbi:hypothetical protein [Candidatus Parabeggiatoa sp. HSG14]|uniref:hypothetical protein n=1 Tax=Candidatus Parabeggiatoa sp. HSG14 TaxID=3055593 RepID=UPI0025A6CF7B|nr:hypothetical protein [Thiotrichales bacterium HSG14]
MPYSTFKSVGEVTQKFDIEVRIEKFIEKKEMKIPDYIFSRIELSLIEDAYFINDFAICEHIISHILDEVSEHYKQLLVWSRAPFNIDKEQDLVGEPDYLIAPKTKHGVMSIPPLCVMEAKQEKWNEGWAQTLAEMYAASIKGAKICYGVVTTGKAWEFAKFENNVFTKDPTQISATEDLKKVLDVLNWLFSKANANINK